MFSLFAVTLAVFTYGIITTVKSMMSKKPEVKKVLRIRYRENDPSDFMAFIKEPLFDVTDILNENLLKDIDHLVLIQMDSSTLLRALKLADVKQGYLEVCVSDTKGRIIRYIIKIPDEKFNYPFHLVDFPKEVEEATIIVNGESYDVSDLAAEWDTTLSGQAGYRCMIRDAILDDPNIYHLFLEAGRAHLNLKYVDSFYHICKQYTSIARHAKTIETE